MEPLSEENSENLENYSKPVKEEPLDDDVKNGLFQYPNQEGTNEVSVSLPIWSFLVSRCHFLLQENEKSGKFNPSIMTKILVKEVNELLSDILRFFQECYNPMNPESFNENYAEDLLEVEGQ